MDHGRDSRPGDHELSLAVRSGAVSALAVVLAQVTGISTAPLALSTTFLLYLVALLAAARTLVALWIAVWRRRRT